MADEERIEFHERRLAVKLTDGERIQKAKEMAQAVEELASEKTQNKAVRSQLKAKEDEIQARVAGLAATVHQGVEFRNVRCYGVADFDNARVKFFREDTQEFVGDRALKMDERQREIPGVQGEGGTLIAIDGGKTEEPFNKVKGVENVYATECGHVTAQVEGEEAPALCAACLSVKAQRESEAAGGPEEPDEE